MGHTRFGSLSITCLMQAPGKQQLSREQVRTTCGCVCTPQMIITHHHLSLFLTCSSCYAMGAGLAALLSSDDILVTVSFSFSVCRTMKLFCRGPSHFGAGFFLLLVFLMKFCHFSSLDVPVEEHGAVCPWTVDSMQTACESGFL